MFQPTAALTVSNAQTMLEAGLSAIAEGQEQFDMAGLTVVDSAAVATMLAWQRAACARGTPLAFSNLSANLRSLVDLYDVADLLNAASTAKARADLPHH